MTRVIQVPTWTDEIPAGCECQWRDDGDRAGSYLVAGNPACPVHLIAAMQNPEG